MFQSSDWWTYLRYLSAGLDSSAQKSAANGWCQDHVVNLLQFIQFWTLHPQIYPVIPKNEQELMVKLQENSKDKPFLLPTFTRIVSKEETGGECMVSFILYA